MYCTCQMRCVRPPSTAGRLHAPHSTSLPSGSLSQASPGRPRRCGDGALCEPACHAGVRRSFAHRALAIAPASALTPKPHLTDCPVIGAELCRQKCPLLHSERCVVTCAGQTCSCRAQHHLADPISVRLLRPPLSFDWCASCGTRSSVVEGNVL